MELFKITQDDRRCAQDICKIGSLSSNGPAKMLARKMYPSVGDRMGITREDADLVKAAIDELYALPDRMIADAAELEKCGYGIKAYARRRWAAIADDAVWYLRWRFIELF